MVGTGVLCNHWKHDYLAHPLLLWIGRHKGFNNGCQSWTSRDCERNIVFLVEHPNTCLRHHQLLHCIVVCRSVYPNRRKGVERIIYVNSLFVLGLDQLFSNLILSTIEGEYIELVNDLKEQYISMKEGLMKKITDLEEEKKYSTNNFKFAYLTTQFISPRPCASHGRYSSYLPMAFYYCFICGYYHPGSATCFT